jgi:hypothetical protein
VALVFGAYALRERLARGEDRMSGTRRYHVRPL